MTAAVHALRAEGGSEGAPAEAPRTLRRQGVEGENPEMLYTYLAPLRPFLKADGVTEVAVNEPGFVWTESCAGWEVHPVKELTLSACQKLALLIANYNRKAITAERPVLSANLIYGERAQIVMPPACTVDTVSMTIRKPSIVDKSVHQLEAEGSFEQYAPVDAGLQPFEHELLALKKERRVREFLQLAVRSKRNILIVGATGSGKTTITRSLIQCIPPTERLITIEDAHELFLHHHKNKVHLFYARGDEGGSKVTAKQALASCLRMKPDRILLAELRGDESWEFIKSVNTGHPGSITTAHANGAEDAFEQIAALIKDSQTGAHLDTTYIGRRLRGTIDVVLFYDRFKLREIYYDPERKRANLV